MKDYYSKAKKILTDHYKSILKVRKHPITDEEIRDEIKHVLKKWDNIVWFENYNFVHKMDKKDWEKALEETMDKITKGE